MPQIEIYFGVIVVVVIVIAVALYFALVRRKEEEVVAEAVIEEVEEKPVIEAPEIAIDLTEVRGIGQKRSEQLKAAGIDSVKDLAEYSPKDLADKVGVSEKIVSRWIKNAKETLSRK